MYNMYMYNLYQTQGRFTWINFYSESEREREREREKEINRKNKMNQNNAQKNLLQKIT